MKMTPYDILLIAIIFIGMSYVLLTIFKQFVSILAALSRLALLLIQPILFLCSERLCKKISDCDIRLQKLFDICQANGVHVFIGIGTSRVKRSSQDGRLDTIILEQSMFGKKKDKDYMVVVFAHELSHVLWDRENDYAISTHKFPTVKNMYDYEARAWERVEKLFKDNNIHAVQLQEIQEVSLKTYADAVYTYVQDNALREVVKHLTAEETVRLAAKAEELYYDRDI